MLKRTPLPPRAKPLKRSRLKRRRNVERENDWALARATALSRAGNRCQADIERICQYWANDVHHLRLRSRRGKNDQANLLAVCRPCHRWVHDHPAEATTRGFMRSGWDSSGNL